MKFSSCHPNRPLLFSYRNAQPWERGLCAPCRAAVHALRQAEAKEPNAFASASASRVRGLGPLAALPAAQYLSRVLSRARALPAPRGVSLETWLDIIRSTDGECVYCSKRSSRLGASCLVPGIDRPENIVPACPRCVHCRGRRLITEWPAARAMMFPPAYAALVARTRAFKV